jgi:hypothetical protein
MTDTTDPTAAIATPPVENRPQVRKRIAELVQWACARSPMTIAADDAKALVVAELILREVEGAEGLMTEQPNVPAADRAAEPLCVCGHPMHLHHEDVCLTECGCNDGRETESATDLPGRLADALAARYTQQGKLHAGMRRHEQGPDGWPASHPVGPRDVAEVLRELLAAFAVEVVLPAPADRAAVLEEAAPVKQRADCTELEWAEQERARFERLYTRETARADLAEQRADTAARDAGIYQKRLERLSEGYTEQRKRAEAMERAMESTAADALAHRGCHRDLMAQCLRAERAEAEAERLRADRAAEFTAADLVAALRGAGAERDKIEARVSADQAAVLREAADWFDRDGRGVSQMWGHQVAAELRRMADEAVVRRVAAETPQPETQAAVLLALVRDFLDPDPCQFDHHGYCQAHAAGFDGEPMSCPHRRAREVLEEIDGAQPGPAAPAQPGKEA